VKDPRDLENRIFAEQVRLLFKQYPPSALTGTLVSLLVYGLLNGQAPANLLVGWIITLNFCLLGGYAITLLYRRDRSASDNSVLWFRRYMVATALVAVAWASLVVFLKFGLSPIHQTVVIMVMVGAASSALVLAIPVLPAYFVFLSLPMLSVSLWLLAQSALALNGLGTLGALFLALMGFAGRNLNQNLINSIKLRYENADLANEVNQLNENLEQRVIEKTHALSESEERFDLAMQGANDGLWDWDIRNATAYFSPRWKSMLGFKEWEISGSPREWQRRIHKDDRRKVLSLIKTHLDGKTKSYESIHRVLNKRGSYIWVLDRGRAVCDQNGKPYRMVGTQVDISDHKHLEEKIKSANIQLKHEIKERVQAQKELAHLAKHDPLTSLPNRILFYEQLQVAIKVAEIEDDAIAVLLVDLDNFKHVNDTLGHPVGDRLLIDVSNRLNSIVNKNYFLSRFGGDEFIVILQGCSDSFIVEAYAREIIELVSQPFHLEDQEIRIGCSIGITLFPDHGKEPDQLIRDADIAMYHAKNQGRNMFQYFTEQMDQEITEKVTMRNMLHGALDRNEFDIHYQPQVDIATGKITGLEALLRWLPTEIENVSPDRFVPLLEEAGLISSVGNWVLHEACQQLALLQKRGLNDLKMAVNISPRQFLEEGLVENIENTLTKFKIPARSLEIEITENVFMEDLELVRQSLSKLKELGVLITLDDFGTGYSSLGYLKRFPINGVKIDKVFVRDILNSDDSRGLVNAIIAMAKGLNLDYLIAEGVETEIQLQHLRQAGCPTYQGYLYSCPLPRKELEALLFPRNHLKSL